MGTSPPYISALCDSRRPEVDVDIYQAHPVCRSFRAGPSPVLNIGASTGLKYRRPSFLSVESWYLISLPLLPIDMNNQFRPPGTQASNHGVEDRNPSALIEHHQRPNSCCTKSKSIASHGSVVATVHRAWTILGQACVLQAPYQPMVVHRTPARRRTRDSKTSYNSLSKHTST